jgi:hypothetical protein
MRVLRSGDRMGHTDNLSAQGYIGSMSKGSCKTDLRIDVFAPKSD